MPAVRRSRVFIFSLNVNHVIQLSSKQFARIFYAFRLVLVLNIQGTFFDFPLCAQRFSGTNTDDVAVLCEGLAHLRRARLI